MESTNTYEPAAWPRDFDFRIEVSEQQELLEMPHPPANETEGTSHEQD